ncbi:MAG: OsmC family protein [Bacilli bacterium]|nr:OsmC family protein [Bacilli bacterium]
MNIRLKSEVTLKDGVVCEAVSGHHKITFDESKEDGGTDTSLNPMEGLLASLGGCQAITAKYLAGKVGIDLKGFRIEVEGDFDMSGFNGDPTDIGYHSIQLTMHIDANNTKEEIEKFAKLVESKCPVSETIKHKVHVLPTKVVCEA